VQYKSPLLQSLQSNLRLQHLSRRTEAAYVYWVKRFVRFSGLRHPSELGPSEIRAFLSHLVVERKLSAATQQQALSALPFFYRKLLGRSLKQLGRLPTGRVPTTLPVVLTPGEVTGMWPRRWSIPMSYTGVAAGCAARQIGWGTVWVRDWRTAPRLW
jgi:site-specific recombinase XerD